MRKLLALVVACLAFTTSSVCAVAIKGVVVNTNGNPIKRAKVCVYADNRQLSEKSRYTILYSDVKGRFRFNQPQGCSHYYFADAKGYAYSMVYRGKSNPKSDVRITLRSEKRLYGRVVDSNGKPISGATVRIRVFSFWDSTADEQLQQKPWFWFGERSNLYGVTTSDKHGNFTLRHVPDTSPYKNIQMRVEAKAPGHALVTLYVTKQILAKKLHIVEPQAVTVSGTAYLPGRKQTAPAGLEIDAQVGSATATAFVDKHGKYSFDLPIGAAAITLAKQGPRFSLDEGAMAAYPMKPWTMKAVANIKLKPEKKTNLDLEFVRGSFLKGKVVDEETGKLVSGGRILARHSGRVDGAPEELEINKKGEFSLRVPPGDVEIAIEYIQSDGNTAYNRAGGSVNFKAENGVDKTDLVLKVVGDTANDYSVSSKSIPAGFELKPGTYQLSWDPDLAASGEGDYISGSSWNDSAKAKMKKLPKLISKTPAFLAVPFDGAGDDGLLLAVLDESKGGKGFDRVYIDLNRNADLTDDKPIKWAAYSKNYAATVLAEVQSHQGSGTERTENLAKVRLLLRDGRPQYLSRLGGWKGTIDSSKGAISAVVVDSNSNGLYNDVYKCTVGSAGAVYQSYSRGDKVFADTNGFGKAVPSSYSTGAQNLMQGGVNLINDKGYIVKANAVGNSITVEPYTGQMGTLLVRGENIAGQNATASSCNLMGEPGSYNPDKMGQTAITLPIGKYCLGYCSLEIGSGEKKLTISGNIEKPIEILPDEQTTITITGKLKIAILPNKTEVILTAQKSEPISWGMSIGDSFTNVRLSSIGKVAPRVAFDKSGTMLTCKASGGG